jgi:hypothetical protein
VVAIGGGSVDSRRRSACAGGGDAEVAGFDLERRESGALRESPGWGGVLELTMGVP